MDKPLKLKNGMIAVTDGTISPSSKKWLDIEITNSFPMISLPGRAFLVSPRSVAEDISGYEHLSIPADLRLHLSRKNGHIFFNANPAWDLLRGISSGPLHFFTYVGLPIDKTPYLYGGRSRKWNEAVLLSPLPDDKFEPASTRVFVDFFLHLDANTSSILHAPFSMQNMRLAFDRSGSTLGPCAFSSIQRRDKPNTVLLFTLRFGYAELEINDAAYLYVPLDIRERRA